MKIVYTSFPKGTMQPIIWLERQANIFRVHDVRVYSGKMPEQPLNRLLPITPPVSDILYVALTGHRFLTSPDDLSLALARCHRAFIARCQMYPVPDDMKPEKVKMAFLHFHLAHKLIKDFGPYIQPWLGVRLLAKCNGNGKPPLHPYHEHRISLLENLYELETVRWN